MDDTKWLDEDDEFQRDRTRYTGAHFLLFSVLNEIGEVDEDFEVPKDASTEPYLRGYMDLVGHAKREITVQASEVYGRKAISPIHKPA